MKKILIGLYGIICYILGLTSLIAFILFANNHFVDVGIATGMPILGAFSIDLPAGGFAGNPYIINYGLIALFGLQHTIMARQGFKDKLTKVLPKAMERSTYVLATALAIFILIFYWRAMSDIVWQIDAPILRSFINILFWAGWLISFLATQMIDGMHLMGVRQAMNADTPDAQNKNFVTPMFYKLVRHPIQTGIIIAMVATPDMTIGRAILASGVIIYIFIGLYCEERDLIKEFGDTYREYMKRVPGLFPRPFGPKK